jgi:hypothetical protein
MASLQASQSVSETQPLDYSLPPSSKRGRRDNPVIVTPKQTVKQKAVNLSQKFQHQQEQKQIQQQQYGPAKPNRNTTFGDGLEIHSGYSGSLLDAEIHSFNFDGDGVRRDLKIIRISAKEYSVLKDLHGEILNDLTPSFNSSVPDLLSYSVSETLDINVHFVNDKDERKKRSNEISGDSEYTVNLIRTDPESGLSVTIEMYPEEFIQLDKSLKSLWFVFSKYPKNMEKSPMTRKMLDRLSLEMIRMINDEYPEVVSFDSEEFQDPKFASAFFKAYAKLTNFGYIHTISSEMAKEFDKDEYDLFALLFQCAHQIELLCTAMNVLFKSQ